MEVPKTPFPGISAHLHPPRSRVRTWFIEPAGMYNKLDAGAPVTAAVATHISEHVYDIMRARFPLATRYLFVHDFSEASSYETQGRQILTQWATRVRSQIDNIIVVVPPFNSIFLMGVNTVAMVLRLGGIPFEVVQSYDEVRARYPIRPCTEG